jgi:hypothetical protein
MALERGTHTRPLRLKRYARQVAVSRRIVAVAWTGPGVGLPGAAVSADLGGSSKYLSENLRD